MPSQELDANGGITFRRYEESGVFEDSEGHLTITGEHESGITSRIRVPLDEVEPEIRRYAEEQVAAIVEDKRAEFHDFVRSTIEGNVTSIDDVVTAFLDELEDELDLTEPQVSEDDAEEEEQTSQSIEAEEEVSTSSEAEASPSTPL